MPGEGGCPLGQPAGGGILHTVAERTEGGGGKHGAAGETRANVCQDEVNMEQGPLLGLCPDIRLQGEPQLAASSYHVQLLVGNALLSLSLSLLFCNKKKIRPIVRQWPTSVSCHTGGDGEACPDLRLLPG